MCKVQLRIERGAKQLSDAIGHAISITVPEFLAVTARRINASASGTKPQASTIQAGEFMLDVAFVWMRRMSYRLDGIRFGWMDSSPMAFGPPSASQELWQVCFAI